MGDYIKDEKTGSIIKGNPTVDYYLKYLYTFMRKTGVLTDAVKSNKSVTNFPNCGAPTLLQAQVSVSTAALLSLQENLTVYSQTLQALTKDQILITAV